MGASTIAQTVPSKEKTSKEDHNSPRRNGTPPLTAGDFLTRHEFERRYHAHPELKKAEHIEGIVYMASPLRIVQHGNPHARIVTWLGYYWAATPGIELGDNATVRLDVENEPQPDALLRIDVGGQSTVDEDGYVAGAPELIAEVAASSASYDLHDKLDAYRRNQVQEYLVWRVGDGAFDWFYLQSGQYVKLAADEEGVVRSQVFPGLWLQTASLLEGDLAQVLVVQQQGLSSPAHQRFIERLALRSKPGEC